MLHRLNITDNESYEIKDEKKHLVFYMENAGRKYVISN
jgi:hypothetical protein